MARLRKRQKEEIIVATLKRISPAAGGSAPGPVVTGVSSYNSRTGAVVSQLSDIVTHTHPESDVVNLVADLTARVLTSDSRLSDARTPLAHAPSHKSGGSDAIKLDELSAPTDVTTLNADTAKHGLLPKLPGGTANFLRADGAFAPPPASPTAYDPGTVSIVNDQFLLQDRHLYLSSSNRLTLAGTAEVLLSDFGNCATVILGSPKTPSLSFIVPTEYFLEQLFRLALSGQMRASLQGTADLILNDDFKTRSRIVLAGMG